MKQLSLTQDQKDAVNAEASRLLLVAPAGSGKTEVLVRRLERVLSESPGESFRVLGVTYTVKAAEELRARIVANVADEAWRVDCDTLHGFALEWLMRYGQAAGIGPDVVVYSADVDRMSVIADYLRTLGLGSKLTRDLQAQLGPMLKAIDDHRTLSPGEPVPETSFQNFGIGLPELLEAYDGSLTRAGGIDFPGMLLKLTEVMELDPWVAETFHSTYRHILVDEGQDLTPAQARLLTQLAGPNVSVFVVADERQSINAFAGGSFDNALQVVGPNAQRLNLFHNFRCAERVLSAAERVAGHLRSRPPKTMAVVGAPPGEVHIVRASNPADEAQQVAHWIRKLQEQGLDPSAIAPGEDPTVRPDDTAVIARTRWLLDPVVRVLQAAGQAVSMNVEATDLFRTPEGRIFLAALAVLVDPSDRPAQRRLSDDLTPLLSEEYSGDALQILRQTSLPELRAIATHLGQLSENQPDLDAVLGGLSASFAGTKWREDAIAIENLWLKYRSAVAVQQRSVKGFLRHVARSQLAKPTDPGVRVLTIHRVKGLEFRAVAIVGARQGALPDYRARSAADLDSERRGLYVAMTRARRALHISWPRVTTDRYGGIHSQEPSQFLREAGLVD